MGRLLILNNEMMANLKSGFGLAILLLYGGNKGGILVQIRPDLYDDLGNF